MASRTRTFQRGNAQVRENELRGKHVPDEEFVGAGIGVADVVGQPRRHVDLAGLVRGQKRLLVIDQIDVHCVDVHCVGVPVVGILLQEVMIAVGIFREVIGAVAQAGLGVLPPGGVFQRSKSNLGGIKRPHGQQAREVGAGGLQCKLQRIVVQCHRRYVVEASLAAARFLGAHDGIEDTGINGHAVFRIQRTLNGVDEVGRRHRGTVGPLAVFAQVEGPDQAVLRDLIALRGLVDHVPVRVEADQRIDAHLAVFGPHVDGDARRIEISRTGKGRDVQDLLCPFCRSTGHRRNCQSQDQQNCKNFSDIFHFVYLRF